MTTDLNHLNDSLRGELLANEPMSKHTSWKIGGPADWYFRPADLDDMIDFLKQVPSSMPLTWMGLGSNVLVRDGGLRGVVVATSGRLNQMQRLSGNRIRVEAGVGCARIARFAVQEALQGVEFLSGIPGTLGGALTMNAGAFGGETWNHVESVELLDRSGRLTVRQSSEYSVGYRSVRLFEGEWFVAATLKLQSGSGEASRQRVKQGLEKRNATQPVSLPSCGSVFRNPKGDHAARMIEACGLKGYQQGQAQVSEKHANFIINLGDAKAADVEALILHVQDTVEAEFGVRLIPEVHMIGEEAA